MVYSISLYTVASLLIFTVTEADKVPSPCGMGMSGCQTIIGTWAVGANGECSHKDTGFRIGQNGFKHVMMQVGVRANRPLLFFMLHDAYIHVQRNQNVEWRLLPPVLFWPTYTMQTQFTQFLIWPNIFFLDTQL